MAGQPFVDEPLSASLHTHSSQGHYDPIGRPIRRDTSSTVSSGSDLPVPLAPGLYTLPIHGSCPKCHHQHKAAAITVRVRPDSSGVSHVKCENCHEKWFAFGAGNSTRISLLSTYSIEPDVVEQDFRYALVEMVKSVTAIASPTALASVPEKPSRVPSREPSTRTRNVEHGPSHPRTSNTKAQSSLSVRNNNPSNLHDANDKGRPAGLAMKRKDTGPSGKMGKLTFHEIKRKLRNRLSELKNFRPREFIQRKGKTHLASLADENVPMVQINLPNVDIDVPLASANTQIGSTGDQHPQAGGPVTVSHNPSGTQTRTAIAPLIPLSDTDKEHLKGLTREERLGRFQQRFSDTKESLKMTNKDDRVKWLRDQLSELRGQQPFAQQQRRTPGSTDASRTDNDDMDENGLPPPRPSPQSPPQRPERRYSIDLPFIGSHMHPFAPGELYRSRPFSIGSSTRLSQAATAVNPDGLTAISGVPSFDNSSQQQRQRARSPRPHSLRADISRLRHSMGPGNFTGWPSMDSLTSTGAVRSFAGGSVQAERHSVISVPSVLWSADIAPSLSSHGSTLYLNGHRTSEERRRSEHRRSSSTTPTP